MSRRANTERLRLADAIEDGRAPGAEPDTEAGRLTSLGHLLEALPAEAWDPPAAPATPPRFGPEPRARRSLVLRPAAAMACALVLLAVGLAAGRALDGGDGPPAPGSRATLAPVAGAGGAAGRVSFDNRPGGRIQVSVDGLRPSSGHSHYELWLMDGDGRLVSLGTFRVPAGGHAELRARLPVAPRSYEFLDVSREPNDGNPAHSSASVLRGPTGRS